MVPDIKHNSMIHNMKYVKILRALIFNYGLMKGEQSYLWWHCALKPIIQIIEQGPWKST